MKKTTTNLLTWYDQNKRSLPWRAVGNITPNPYHVWMSEIMLQQTTVATVKGYFDKFLTLWPTVNDLAGARQEDVLAQWAGLGYYARARNLHKCAQEIVANYGGHFPDTYTQLKSLPGIGDYTAAAIASIAFNQSSDPVVDGNVERVVTRLYRIQTQLPMAKTEIKSETAKLTPNSRPGDFAQAMMDLGATVCSPKKPKCDICPIEKSCAAHKHGDAETYPRKAPKKVKPTRRSVAFTAIHDGHIYLERRSEKDMLGGMLGLPHTPWIARDDIPNIDEAKAHVPVKGNWVKVDGMAKHTFTHFHLETNIYTYNLNQKFNSKTGEWVAIKDIKTAGLPTVFLKMVSLIMDPAL